jgi:chromosomal replication initiator protein
MEVWARVLSTVAKKVNRQNFDTWFKPIVCVGRDEKALHLEVPNENFRERLLHNYGDLLRDVAREVAQTKLLVEITAVQHAATNPILPTVENTLSQPDASPPLVPKYTFDSFIVGASNQFAHAAAIAVAEQPSKAYNPFYIYGGVGLGKTHLMHAIGNFILRKNSKLHLAYMSSERFMNELVNSIRYDRTIQFRQKYRNIDVLLMDDIQFLAGKERTQEEFFHTFNALYDAQKQIVITSDCPPKEIPTIEERLHSRFEWGLIADIQPPDLETKLAILRKKAESGLRSLPDAVAIYLATSIRSNIRELEGALTRLSARASLDGIDASEITIDYARRVLNGIIVEERSTISSEMVMRAVAAHFGLKPLQLKSKSNSRFIVHPRQIAMYVCKQMTKLSLPQIGKDFGGKHHTTVLHSIRKVESMKNRDTATSEALDKILRAIR